MVEDSNTSHSLIQYAQTNSPTTDVIEITTEKNKEPSLYDTNIKGYINRKNLATLYKLCMASIFHDITLPNDRLSTIRSLDELEEQASDFTKNELELFRNHTIHAAQLVQKFRTIPEDVANIIAQHHEMPDGSDFPRKLQANGLTPLSCVFIVAHEIVRKLVQNKTTFSMTEEFLPLVKAYDHSSSFHAILNCIDPFNADQKKKQYQG